MATPKEIPRLYHSIKQVVQLTGVTDSTLRYWENVFRELNPRRNKNKVRQYRQSDIELVLHLKHLLWEQNFTLEGAKKKLAEDNGVKDEPVKESSNVAQALRETRRELQEIRRLLD